MQIASNCARTLGGQVHNPSAFPDRMRHAWPEFKALHANTIEFPVYWDTIEPVEGKFDFSGFDEIVRGLRQQNLRAIPLWFARGARALGHISQAPGCGADHRILWSANFVQVG